MAAYLIVNIEVNDPHRYREYLTTVPALVTKHGGEYLARGGRCTVLEGHWKPARLVIFRFPDTASVQALYDDPAYQPLKALRHEVATTDMLVVEGI